ncbi:type IV secretion protein Rhs [Cupriavidus necator]|uniref:Type IV secretion protein Rhs n=1 Tax=Cupriavidus necator TaxID=106590 RepID=A0A1U9URY4_CUPNE|nr:type VI secretion system Vgr family protein [Cupriavidus necator]AQV94905.1 type IV secretion protein Rhs [Cupriavidus necator]
MADLMDAAKKYGGAAVGMLTGRQSYFLEVPGTASAVALCVVSFEAVERMGHPYTVTIQLTHPLALDRADYLGKAATFLIDPADGTEPRKFAGCITHLSQTRQTHDFCGYEIVVEPLVARLKLTCASRIYQHKTAPQIIEAILRRHDLRGHQFAFKTRRNYSQHPFRMQHQMDDWSYIRLLMEQEGLYCYFAPGKFGEMVVFGDDIDHYIYQPELRVNYRETAGLESGQEAVSSLKTHAKTIPGSFLVADFNPDKAWERPTGEANIARKEKTTYGQSYVYGTHHLDFEGARWEAQLRHEAKFAEQLIYAGESNVLALCPARILRMDLALPDAPDGQVITEVIHSGGRDATYRNTYQAIPSDRRYRLPMDEANWPRIHGTLSARITSPGQYKYAYLTQEGRYVVRFDLDFEEWPNGGESVPLAFAKPFAGANQTGFHFPLIDGTYVDVAFRDGNPNKPYIAHVQHNSQHQDLITNQGRWLSRNVIRTQSDNKFEAEDWEGQEHVKFSTEHSGKSQLTLGHIVNGKHQKRGEGFELRTDAQGAVRAGGGLLLSADIQKQANGKQNDTSAAQSQLESVQAQARTLADAARLAKAEIADLQAENAWLKSSVHELKEAVLLLSAPKGIAVATPDRVSVGAGKDVNLATGAGFAVSALKTIVMAAGDALSLFAHNLGIKLLAARGKVLIQAQSDELAMSSLKDLTITSTDGKLILSADKEVWIGAGGSFIRIDACRIEQVTPGDMKEKALAWQRQAPGPQVRKTALPYSTDLPDTGSHSSRFSG